MFFDLSIERTQGEPESGKTTLSGLIAGLDKKESVGKGVDPMIALSQPSQTEDEGCSFVHTVEWQAQFAFEDVGQMGNTDFLSEQLIRFTLWDLEDPCRKDFSTEPSLVEAAHRFLLTSERTLYIVTFNVTKPNLCNIDAWVQTIAQYTEGAPIILVGYVVCHVGRYVILGLKFTMNQDPRRATQR